MLALGGALGILFTISGCSAEVVQRGELTEMADSQAETDRKLQSPRGCGAADGNAAAHA